MPRRSTRATTIDAPSCSDLTARASTSRSSPRGSTTPSPHATAEALRDEPVVVLSGGVFQNALLLERVRERLPRALVPARLPVNDGGISYGQAAVAAARA